MPISSASVRFQFEENVLDSFRRITRDVTSGAVTSVISLVYSLSFAALIFSGATAGGFAQGISALLIGTAVTAFAVAVFSAFRFAVSGPDANACAVMAAMAAAIAKDLSVGVTSTVATSNVLYLLAVSTMITGICLTAMGVARAGRWIRFVPYPVVGGLIAAAGALTVLGALRVIGGASATLGIRAVFVDSQLPIQFGVSLFWAALLFIVLPRIKSAVALPLLQIGGILLFHFALSAAGISINTAQIDGWLFETPLDTAPWMPWHSAGFAGTEWSLLLSHAGEIGTLVLVTTLTVLINATGLEMETRTDANLDRELTVQGASNVLAPLLGGFLGYLSMNRSLMNFRLGATSRLSGIVFAAVAIGLAWSGMDLIGYLPRSLLGGLLLYFGLALLRKWAVDTRQQLPRAEYLTLLLILGVTVVFGFGYGLILGVLVGCVLFAVTYSKIRVVKFSFNGREFRSSHERSADDKALLNEYCEEIRIFVLQGFIFFGMADQLYRTVLETAFPAIGRKARFVVLDLNLVHGVDASAIASFKKISFGTRTAGAQLVITGMRDEQAAEWQRRADPDLAVIRHFPNIDAGAEWCETAVINIHRTAQVGTSEVIRDWLHAEVGDSATTLLQHMRRRSLAAGDILCRQGEPADDMYFIESGRVSIELEVEGVVARRLRTLGPKTILGEMGFYRTAQRSANVVIQEAAVIYQLNIAAMREIEAAHPEVAARFHTMVVKAIADRLEFSNALVAALQR